MNIKAPAPAAAPAQAPAPDEEMPLPHDPKTVYLGGLFLIAVFVVLYVAQAVVLPIVIALVLKLLLQPLVRLLERFHIPKALGALVAVLLLLGVFVMLGAILSSPASNFIRDIPNLVKQMQEKVSSLQGLSERFKPFLEPLGLGEKSPGDLMSVNPGSLAGSVAGGASAFASHLLETLLILFYLLVFGETFMRRLVEVLPRFRDKKQAVEISDTVEKDISAYLLTITIINAVVGVLCGLVMWGCGVPGPLVWAVVAFCLNYIPILGPFAGVALFGVVGLATLGATWFAIVPAALYLAIHFAEGELITPMLLAKRFTLNPVAVMIALVFWYWLWGVQGAILSVPLLAITKIMSDRIRSLKALGHVLEG
ncbi:MAG: AI-2E family transporter [Janthinobacterium lividum]